MSYFRVIPRDLFNEGNLLKCYGRLWINLENMALEHLLQHTDAEAGFNVMQDDSGFTYLSNVKLDDFILYRPVNSREPWPLYALYNDEEYSVFDEHGNFDKMFKDLLKRKYTA